MHNPTSGTELGILTDKDLDIFVLFEFEDIGYVKDADKEKLDGDDILKSIREGNESSNEARKERGWPAITIVGWHTPPFYNRETNNLEWCIKGESQGHTIVNYNTRILGRRGVMSANLMVDPEKLDATLPVVKKLLGGYSFVEGKRYSQYVLGRQDREVRPVGAGRRRRGRPGGQDGPARQARRHAGQALEGDHPRHHRARGGHQEVPVRQEGNAAGPPRRAAAPGRGLSSDVR